MASLYRRPGSKYWWIKYIDPNGRSVRKSTNLRHDAAEQSRQAEVYRSEWSHKEAARKPCANLEAWEFWVPGFLQLRYGNSPLTLSRYLCSWANLSRYFAERELRFPRQLTFNACIDYLAWRTSEKGRHGNYKSCKNTALGELKFLGVVVTHAVRRGFCEANPCQKLGIKKDKAKEKPEISPRDLKFIFEKLQHEPEWMGVSFQIALYTGCRETETWLLLDNVDVRKRLIHFATTKGDKPFTVPMRPELVPLFTRLQSERPGQRAFDTPTKMSIKWWKFFQKIGLGKYCFHCLRVTFITMGARSGVPEGDMMTLVNHASEEIHRIYKRLRPADVRKSLLKMDFPVL
jgi:integrase